MNLCMDREMTYKDKGSYETWPPCSTTQVVLVMFRFLYSREVGGWGRDPKKCTGRDWGMGSSTI